MKNFLAIINQIPLGVPVLLCATLGLAPFTPPHVIEKLAMLAGGTLVKPIDWFDLFFHGTPWVLLALKLAALFSKPPDNTEKQS
jgi:hypothetical protein